MQLNTLEGDIPWQGKRSNVVVMKKEIARDLKSLLRMSELEHIHPFNRPN